MDIRYIKVLFIRNYLTGKSVIIAGEETVTAGENF